MLGEPISEMFCRLDFDAENTFAARSIPVPFSRIRNTFPTHFTLIPQPDNACEGVTRFKIKLLYVALFSSENDALENLFLKFSTGQR
ncbi:MAG: hypothetical protein R3A13_02365 [Bdellovibrionota bacterium]